MKRIISENIKYYIKNIIFIVAILVISIPVWSIFNNESYAATAEYYANYINTGVNINYTSNYYDIENNKYVINMSLNNMNRTNFNYLLFLKVKKSVINSSLSVKLFNTTKNIETLRYGYSESYDYYLIDANSIKDNANYELEILLPNNINIIDYSFEIIENN